MSSVSRSPSRRTGQCLALQRAHALSAACRLFNMLNTSSANVLGLLYMCLWDTVLCRESEESGSS